MRNPHPDTILIPVSLGELFDRISILELKTQHFRDAARRARVAEELALMTDILERAGHPLDDPHLAELRALNAQLWMLEDRIRALDQAGQHGADYVATARQIHQLNDRRFAAKTQINRALGARLIEEKEYGTTAVAGDRDLPQPPAQSEP